MSDLPRSNSIAAQPTIMHNESTAPTPVFDGIQENTNPIPRWWKWILIGTLAFVPMYLLMCHTGAPGSSTVEQFQAAMDANTKKQYQEGCRWRFDFQSELCHLSRSGWWRKCWAEPLR
jgi:hypothetical protein